MRKGDKIGVPRTKEHKLKLSKAMIGNLNQEKIRTIETKLKISSSMFGE